MSQRGSRRRRRSIRLPGYDYSRAGAYFVTICTRGRECLFGDVVDDRMCLTDAGRIVQETWERLPEHYPHVELDSFVVMPNHVHGIIVIRGVGAGFKPAPTTPGATTNNDAGAGPATRPAATPRHGPLEVIEGVGAGLKPAPTTPAATTNNDAGAGPATRPAATPRHGPPEVIAGVGAGFKPAPTTPGATITDDAGAGPATPPAATPRHGLPEVIEGVGAGLKPAPTTPGATITNDAGAGPATPPAATPRHGLPEDIEGVGAGFKPAPTTPGATTTDDAGAGPATRPAAMATNDAAAGPATPPMAAATGGAGAEALATAARSGGGYTGDEPDRAATPRHGPPEVIEGVGAGFKPAPTTPGATITDDAGAGPATRPAATPRHGLPEIVRAFKTFSARRINEQSETPGCSRWQRNYFEHVIRDDSELHQIREYIAMNPRRWSLDREYRAQ